MVLVPIWLTPVLPTTDGHSHIYNAMIGHAVAAGSELYAPVFEVAGGLRPNMATWSILTALGPLIGWPLAERIVASLAAMSLFGGCLFLWRRFGPGDRWLLHASLAGWFATGWLFWMGFYDFSLSLGLLFLLPSVLERPSRAAREGLVLLLLAALYFTHLLTFAFGVALCLFEPLWRARVHGEEYGRVRLLVRLPWLLILCYQLLFAGGLRTDVPVVQQFHPYESLTGLLLGDYLLTFSRLDLVGSLVVSVLVLGWLLHTGRRALGGEVDWSTLEPHVVVGGGLLLASVVVPDLVTEGEYLPTRMRVIGAVFLVAPATRAGLASARAGSRVLSGVLLVGLLVHGGVVLRVGDAVAEDAAAFGAMADSLGAREGGWTQNVVVEWDDGWFRTQPYSHLDDRVNLERGYRAASNYEAFRKAFPVGYTRPPNRLARVDWPAERTVSVVESRARWPDTLFVLHPADFELDSIGEGLEWGPTRRGERIGVTRVVIRSP